MALKDVKVLIVDDELFFRQVLRDMLEKIGFSVVAEAADGKEAVDKYRTHRPHITIMDIFMPEKNGIEATIDILAMDNYAKIVVCTASGNPCDTQAALDVGATAVVLKPFAPRELYDCIKKVMTAN